MLAQIRAHVASIEGNLATIDETLTDLQVQRTFDVLRQLDSEWTTAYLTGHEVLEVFAGKPAQPTNLAILKEPVL